MPQLFRVMTFVVLLVKMMQANGKDEFVEIINSINNIINGTNI